MIAPTDPPENLTVQDSSYTWLLISWNHSRPYFSRNEVEGFLININENGGLFNNTLSVQHIPEEKNISGLKENTEYCIKVKAVTTGGLGEESDELCAFTDQEDGKRRAMANTTLITGFKLTYCTKIVKIDFKKNS